MAKHTAVFGILLLLFYLSSYFAVIVNRETQARKQMEIVHTTPLVATTVVPLKVLQLI